ncbi:MAG: PIN domain-containing protein [Chromatiales bacterium]|nr:PIN domain-containing protein [Chromatiales bacterium]
MSAEAFLDTNILLYAISSAPAEQAKRTTARALLAAGDWGVSVQVLQEFYVNATRGPHPAMNHADATAVVEQFMQRPLVVTDPALMRTALMVKDRYQLAYWDAAIVAAAQQLAATVLYSEDLNAGQDYAGVTVVNPFRV